MINTRIIQVFIIIFSLSCNAEAPVVSESFKDPQQRRNHGEFTECSICHEDRRPPADSHPYYSDCVDCHSYPSFSENIATP